MAPLFADLRLVNGSAGDPVLYVSYPGRSSALLFDGGDNCSLTNEQLSRVEALFVTHHHPDHFVGIDRLIRASLDRTSPLNIFGPEGTLRRIQQRLSAYVFPIFDFVKLVVRVHDMTPGMMRYADISPRDGFALGEVKESPWAGPKLYSNEDVEVEGCFTDHTLPGLAYALVEKPGWHPDPRKLSSGLLRPGPWVGEALAHLRARAKVATVVEIERMPFTLGWLKDRFFGRSQGARVAFIVDTRFSEAVKPALIKLAAKAKRLYCDCYYASEHLKHAETHRHMIAKESAELATLAGVEEMVLIHFSPRYAGRYQSLVDEARATFPRAWAEIH